jgi:tRNA threonylcarbamoyladenosine biosynthesis protein TsaE
MMIFQTKSALETEALGFKLANALKAFKHPVVLLEGDVASGKTTFTKGIAKALGIEDTIKSPSYTLLRSYESLDKQSLLHHFDLYRLDHLGLDFDLEEYIESEDFVVIEWPLQVPELLPNDYVQVSLKTIDTLSREITIEVLGDRLREVMKKL